MLKFIWTKSIVESYQIVNNFLGSDGHRLTERRRGRHVKKSERMVRWIFLASYFPIFEEYFSFLNRFTAMFFNQTLVK
jgi:hypothetical protein